MLIRDEIELGVLCALITEAAQSHSNKHNLKTEVGVL